jgi:hypothetical protein
VITLACFQTLYSSLSSSSFFGIPQNDDPHALFRGLYIASKHDLCQEHMGKYAVIFCDFKLCRSLRTVQTAHLHEVEYYWRFLGGNVFVLQMDGFRPLQGVLWVSWPFPWSP